MFPAHQLSTTDGADMPGDIYTGPGEGFLPLPARLDNSAPASRAARLAAPPVPTSAPRLERKGVATTE